MHHRLATSNASSQLWGLVLGSWILAGCGGDNTTTSPTDASTLAPSETASDTNTDSDSETEGTQLPSHLLVTADWQAHRLSLLDLDSILAGETYASALAGTIDLAGREPGPIQLVVTADAKALVSISPGFFDGSVGTTIGVTPVPASTGELIIVDLDTGTLLAELSPQSPAMGVVLDPVRPQAFTANFGDEAARGTTISVIDLDALAIVDEIEVGDGPEQLAISDDGEAALVSLASAGEIRGFSPADPGATLSPGVVTSGDPSGIAFVPGTHTAIIANSQNSPNYTLVDLTDPQLPVILEQGENPGGIPFAVAARGTRAWFASSTFAQVQINEVDLSGQPSVLAAPWSFDGNTFPLSLRLVPTDVDATTTRALLALPGLDQLAVVDLDSRTVVPIDVPGGPTDLAILIRR